jgi:hypothetical protein
MLTVMVAIPFVILAFAATIGWPYYSQVWSTGRNYDNALVGTAGVAGVLWSGAIIAYSIHRKYTPPLRTGVQIIQYAFLAPIAGLVAQGAGLRTLFYAAAWFYFLSALYSTTNRQFLKPGYFSVVIPPKKVDETPEERQAREAAIASQERSLRLFQRIGHGAPYFSVVTIFCLAITIFARQDIIAWSSLLAIVAGLFLILPELFNLFGSSDAPGDSPT